VFICVSRFIKQKALEAGIPESKLRVHYIGVNLELFTPSDNVSHTNVVLFVGRLIEHKGCKLLLEAMELVTQQCPDAKAVIIGDGPQRQFLERLARQRSIPCQFLGVQPSNVVRDWLRQTRVFCVPSITAANGAQEGLGMVFAEAQAMGVPVVSFRIGGIPEVVRDGETGLLAPEHDCEALARHIIRYLQDEPFWQKSRREAIDWAKCRFDLYRQTRELESIYVEVLSVHKGLVRH
jgi:colanic acid/amylovoran biosynthesis glycosyltransferase